MTDLPTLARELAVNCEARKIAYRQSKDGVVISFLLHPNDVPNELAIADLGSRYIIALVEIGDDETPKQREEPARISHQPAGIEPPARRSFDDLPASTQAGILCGDANFHEFIRMNKPDRWRFLNEGTDTERAALILRSLVGVTSRSEIKPGTKAFDAWRDILREYNDWEMA